MRCLAFLVALSASALPGCGGGNEVRVTGKLTKGGVKYTPPEGQRVSMVFYSIEAKDETGRVFKNEPYLVTIDPDGESFTVPGKEGRGVPPGKYRISVTQKMTREAFGAAKPKLVAGKKADRETDYLEGKFSPEKSPIVRDVDGSKPTVIDLDRPTES